MRDIINESIENKYAKTSFDQVKNSIRESKKSRSVNASISGPSTNVNVSMGDLNNMLDDMTQCVNEIGYKAQVIDSKRYKEI